MSKGSSPRPYSVDLKTFDANWDSVFNRRKKTDLEKFDESIMKNEFYDEDDMQVKVNEEIGRCGCGRSPTGKCIGWHALTEEAYQVELAKYRETVFEEKTREE